MLRCTRWASEARSGATAGAWGATLQREHWNGQSTHLGDRFRVSKMRGDKQLIAVCKLWTHALGWEARLEINGDLQRSEVFRS